MVALQDSRTVLVPSFLFRGFLFCSNYRVGTLGPRQELYDVCVHWLAMCETKPHGLAGVSIVLGSTFYPFPDYYFSSWSPVKKPHIVNYPKSSLVL